RGRDPDDPPRRAGPRGGDRGRPRARRRPRPRPLTGLAGRRAPGGPGRAAAPSATAPRRRERPWSAGEPLAGRGGPRRRARRRRGGARAAPGGPGEGPWRAGEGAWAVSGGGGPAGGGGLTDAAGAAGGPLRPLTDTAQPPPRL